jgi:hypothetical protein
LSVCKTDTLNFVRKSPKLSEIASGIIVIPSYVIVGVSVRLRAHG